MTLFSSILSVPSIHPSTRDGRRRGDALRPTPPSRAGAAALCLAVAAMLPGCVDEPALPDDESASASELAEPTPAVFPSSMYITGPYFIGPGSSIGYGQVRFQYTNSGGAHDFTVPLDSGGGFSAYRPTDYPFRGDRIRATWSGPGRDDVGCSFTYTFLIGGGVYTFAELGCVITTRTANVVVNEILANEAGSATAGEFIELVNLGDGTANLGGWTLSDSLSVRHTFAAATTLAPGKSLVVFAGASAIPAGLGNAIAASSGALALNNTTDVVTLRAADGALRASVAYTADLASSDGVSMNLSPEGSAGSSYALHTTLAATPASPGVRTSGLGW